MLPQIELQQGQEFLPQFVPVPSLLPAQHSALGSSSRDRWGFVRDLCPCSAWPGWHRAEPWLQHPLEVRLGKALQSNSPVSGIPKGLQQYLLGADAQHQQGLTVPMFIWICRNCAGSCHQKPIKNVHFQNAPDQTMSLKAQNVICDETRLAGDSLFVSLSIVLPLVLAGGRQQL